MSAPFELALSNALVAALLALVAFTAKRCGARPVLVHCLWLLVLIKLVTPPIVELDVPLPIAASAPAAVASGSAPIRVERPRAERAVRSTPDVPPPTIAPHRELESVAPPSPSVDWNLVLLTLWALGALFVALRATRQIHAFGRAVRRSKPASPALRKQTAQLCVRMGMTSVPDVRMVSGCVPPMLWGVGRRAKLLLPAQLITRLDVNKRTTLLAHELAHLRRRDHWVRWLELVVRTVWWWNPIVYWACRELRNAEEECCDAWVVWALPSAQRCYADALLETVEFLSDGHHALPPAASGMGRVSNLKGRLTMIMTGRTTKSLSHTGRLLVLLFAAATLPLLPAFGQNTERERALRATQAELQEVASRFENMRSVLADYTTLLARDPGNRVLAATIDRTRAEIAELESLRRQLHQQLQRQDPERRRDGRARGAELNPELVIHSLETAIDLLAAQGMEREAHVLQRLAAEHRRAFEHEPEEIEEIEEEPEPEEVAAIDPRREDVNRHRRETEELHAVLNGLRQKHRDLEEHALQIEQHMHYAEREGAARELTELRAQRSVVDRDRRHLERRAEELEHALQHSDGARESDHERRFRKLENRVEELTDVVEQLTRALRRGAEEKPRRDRIR